MSGESTRAMEPSGLLFCVFLCCFLCRAAVFHASAWVSVQLSLSVRLSTGCGWLMVLVPLVVCHTSSVLRLYVAAFFLLQSGAAAAAAASCCWRSRSFTRWDVVPPAWLVCCRLPAALPLSQGTAGWCVKGTQCLNNSVCQKTSSSAAVIAVLR